MKIGSSVPPDTRKYKPWTLEITFESVEERMLFGDILFAAVQASREGTPHERIAMELKKSFDTHWPHNER